MENHGDITERVRIGNHGPIIERIEWKTMEISQRGLE